MVKSLKKALINEKNLINHTSNTLQEYNSPLPSKKKSINPASKKTKQQIDKENYQKNKEKKKQQRRERYQQQKIQAQQTENEQLSKYYGAEAIRILMSFKEYTELNKEKRQLWLDFN
jgi:hypothetical protein